MKDSKYYLILTKVSVLEFSDLDLVYKYIVDNGLRLGQYMIIKGEQVL